MPTHPLARIACISLAGFALASCASTNYLAYQGAPVVEGHGGACRNVDGIDIWQEGTPPRKFRIVGVVTDSRFAGPIAMAGRNKGIAQMAKQHGGDAVLLSFDQRQVTGTVSTGSATTNVYGNAYAYGNTASVYGTANTFATGTTVPIVRADSKFYVVKYQ